MACLKLSTRTRTRACSGHVLCVSLRSATLWAIVDDGGGGDGAAESVGAARVGLGRASRFCARMGGVRSRRARRGAFHEEGSGALCFVPFRSPGCTGLPGGLGGGERLDGLWPCAGGLRAGGRGGFSRLVGPRALSPLFPRTLQARGVAAGRSWSWFFPPALAGVWARIPGRVTNPRWAAGHRRPTNGSAPRI